MCARTFAEVPNPWWCLDQGLSNIQVLYLASLILTHPSTYLWIDPYPLCFCFLPSAPSLFSLPHFHGRHKGTIMPSLYDSCICMGVSRDRVLGIVSSLPLFSPSDASSDYEHARILLLMVTVRYIEYERGYSATWDV